MSSDSLASTMPAGSARIEPEPMGTKPRSATVRVGVIGYGYWGPNIVRNFHGLEHCEVVVGV